MAKSELASEQQEALNALRDEWKRLTAELALSYARLRMEMEPVKARVTDIQRLLEAANAGKPIARGELARLVRLTPLK